MQVTETENQGLKRAFSVTVPSDDIEARVSAKLTEVAKTIQIPGFRPGKVPLTVLRKRYGPHVMGEVLEGAVQDSIQQTLKERELRPAMQPKIDVKSFDEGKDLEFELSFEVLPEFEMPDFSKIELERLRAEIKPDDIDGALSRLAENNKMPRKIEEDRVAREGDVLLIDFVGKIDGEAFDGGTAEGIDLEIGAGRFIPGFEEQLVGARAGEDRQVEVTFPEDYQAAHLAGKHAVFDVTVKEIRELAVPEIDADFAEKAGVKSVEELRERVESQLRAEYDRIARDRLKRALLDKLADMHDFPVPEGMQAGEFEAIWKQVEHAREQGHLDPEDRDKSEDELKAEYRDIAARRVRLGLILSEAGRSNGIEVTEQDMNRAIAQQASQYPGQAERVYRYFVENKEAQEQLRGPIFEDKVVDYVLELANVSEKSVPADELIGHDHDHDHDHGHDHNHNHDHDHGDEGKAKKTGKAKPAAKKAAAKKPASKSAAKADDPDKAGAGAGNAGAGDVGVKTKSSGGAGKSGSGAKKPAAPKNPAADGDAGA